jgi:hypothetical protein
MATCVNLNKKYKFIKKNKYTYLTKKKKKERKWVVALHFQWSGVASRHLRGGSGHPHAIGGGCAPPPLAGGGHRATHLLPLFFLKKK